MKYDFDRPARRTERFRLKYEDLGRRFGRPDVLPLWVADMDFPTAEPVIRALTARAAEFL